MSYFKTIVCLGLMVTIGLSADSDKNNVIVHNVSYPCLEPNNVQHVHRLATKNEIALIDYRAQQDLAYQKAGFFKWYAQGFVDNSKYVATADPFGIPYGFSIAAACTLAGIIYWNYYKNTDSKKE